MHVRPAVVKAALEWLIQNNAVYMEAHEKKLFAISAENLAAYKDNEVPEALLAELLVSGKLSIKKSVQDTSGYTQPDVDLQPEHKDPGDSSEQTDSSTGWLHSGLADVQAQAISPHVLEEVLLLREAAEEKATQQESKAVADVLLVPAGAFANLLDRRDPSIFHGAFPTLFPFGVGGPTSPRKRHIPLGQYARHLMLHAERRFSVHPPLVFTLFNQVQRHMMSSNASQSLKAGYFMDFSKELHNLTSEKLDACINEMKGQLLRGKYPRWQNTSDPELRSALKHVFSQVNAFGTKPLPLTASSKRRARQEAFGMMIKHGMPDFFITINPEDRHAPLVCHFGQRNVNLKLSDPDKPGPGFLSCRDRKRLVANDSLAAAKFSHTLMQAFIRSLLGFDPNHPNQPSTVGVLGDVKAHHFNPETQNRGSLHFHGMVWLQHKPGALAFEELLRSADFQQRVLHYLSFLIKQEYAALWPENEMPCPLSLPEGHRVSDVICGVCGETHKVVEGPGLESQRNNDIHISSKRIGDPESKSFNQDFMSDLHQIIPQLSTHMTQHTETCFSDAKNRNIKHNKGEPETRVCRFKFPRPLVQTAQFTEDGRIMLRRLSHWVNNFCPYFSAALRCNHDIQTMWGSDTQTMVMLVYMTNYMTKLDKTLLNQIVTVAHIQDGVKRHKLYKKSGLPDDPQKEAKTILVRIFNQLQRDVELSFQAVVASLAGLPERYVSEEPLILSIQPFLVCIEGDDRERGHEEIDSTEHEANQGGFGESFRIMKSRFGNSISNIRMDYQLRPTGLEHCSLYDFKMCWDRVPLSWKRLEGDGEENEINPKKERPSSRLVFRFLESHNQSSKVGLRFRFDYEQHAVVLKGPWIHGRDRYPSRFARQILLLFKPFRKVSDLRPDGMTWMEALHEFEQAASPRVQAYIENIESIATRRELWETDLENKTAQSSNCDESFHSHASDDEVAEEFAIQKDDTESVDDSSHIRFEPDQQAQRLTYMALIQTNIFLHSANEAVVLCCNVADTKQGNNERRRQDPWYYPSQADAALFRQWKQELAAQRQRVIAGKSQLESDLPLRLNDSDGLPALPEIRHIENTSVDSIANKFTLNYLQRAAFLLVADAFNLELQSPLEPVGDQTPLRLYVGGPGGTGKSQIVKAILALFAAHARQAWIATTAPTGTAASAIKGSTIHSVFSIPRTGANESAEENENKISKQQSSKFRTARNLKELRFLIMDEISMIGCYTLSIVDRKLHEIMGGDVNISFGGIHVIAFGDYCQLKPVGATSLFEPNLGSQKSNATHQGRALWLQFNKVVLLTEQNRQLNDQVNQIFLHSHIT